VRQPPQQFAVRPAAIVPARPQPRLVRPQLRDPTAPCAIEQQRPAVSAGSTVCPPVARASI
jgi:hypothetical protein